MATNRNQFQHFQYGGVDQSRARHLVADGVWSMLNLRPDNGRLVQTPWLVNNFNLSLLTDESSATTIKLLRLVRNANGDFRYLVGNHKNFRYIDPVTPATQVLIPTVRQIAVPNTVGVTGQCLLYGISTLDFGAADDQFDVKIVSSTQFQWRKNAGSWSASLTCAPEVSIGTGLKVSFLEVTGYTTNDTWSWKRTTTHGYTGADSSTYNFPWHFAPYQGDVYIGGVEREVMRIRGDIATSVGYVKAYGKYVGTFKNHLMIGQYAAGAYHAVSGVADGYSATNTPWTLAWSHRDNPDLLFSTAVNEADEYRIPTQAAYDQAPLGITGMAEWAGRYLVYLSDSVSVVGYVGLPTVMQIDTLNPAVGNIFPAGLVVTPRGHYFFSREGCYKYDGSFTPIGARVDKKFFEELAPVGDYHRNQTHGYYDADNNRVVWTYWRKISASTWQTRQIVYDERQDAWYFRNLPCTLTGATGDIFALSSEYAVRGGVVYGGTGNVYRDYTSETTGFVKDDYVAGLTTYTSPQFETGFMAHGSWFDVKEHDTLFIDATNSIQAYVATPNYVGDAVPVWTAMKQIWTPQLREGRLSVPRVAGRQVAYKFTFLNPSNTKPALGCYFNGYEEFIRGAGAEK